ncbi:hydroxymethylglutaryl-CoA lyase [Streptomyces zagrosensis]|uniref:Hydroxymethylglutaryl-CoA lyase n=2 Tax=Streptomyces zagrosensis TaxID=1042984 RepID=A0A7W9UXN6_9ACTN|nr:hydroxymethylglutaryl-CoA lyase [Streptomyces zagrosensis]MBB5935103.1 hydroxymethylglutaryl-CoA lyase [Streptomyces zagrosensis]
MIEGLPMAVPAPGAGLPARVRIYEVGARDGLQNEKAIVPVEVKAEFIRRLAAAGLGTIEATSFVHPKWVPQLADAEQLMPLLDGLGVGPGGTNGSDSSTGDAAAREGAHGGAGTTGTSPLGANPARTSPVGTSPAGTSPVGIGRASASTAGADGAGGVRLPVLVPNERGVDRALALGVRDIAVFGSATESFAKANLNRTVDEALAMFAPVIAKAAGAGARVRGYLSMCFGDPWEGPVPIARVADISRRLLDLGCDELSLGDTIGVATPGHVSALLTTLNEAGVPTDRIGVHFHDTYGQALANTLAALQHGVTTVDASAGGLGGCPYAKSATGNLATEDLVWMLHGLGIDTGVDLGRLTATSVWMADQLGRPSPSRTVRALSHKEP